MMQPCRTQQNSLLIVPTLHGVVGITFLKGPKEIMAETSWQKSDALAQQLKTGSSQRRMYMIAGVALIGVVAFLIVNGTIFGGRYYMTVDELVDDPEFVGKSVRISAAVDGNMIEGESDYSFDSETHDLVFWVANISNDSEDIRAGGGIAKVLYDAVNDPTATRLMVVVEDAEVPELLQHEAQAILEGELGADGIFYATSLQLKCPTKYNDDNPERVAEE